MTILGTLNILLFFAHIAALLTCTGTVIYFLSIWVSGRHRSASLFPFPEVELATKILGAALAALWLTNLPVALVGPLNPERYYSTTGVTLLGILTLIAILAVYVMIALQNRISESRHSAAGAGIHAGFRFISAALPAVLILLLLLLLPGNLLSPAYAVLDPNDILPEILLAFGFLLMLFSAITMIFNDRWFDRIRAGR